MTGSAGAAGPFGPTGAQGLQGVAGPIGATGLVPTYGVSGLINGAKIWVGTVSTDASGNFSQSIATANCATVPVSAQVGAIATTQNAGDAVHAVITSRTTTTVSGNVTLPNSTAIALGGTAVPNKKAGAGVVVMLSVICN